MNYSELVGAVHGVARYLDDPAWNAWCDLVTRDGRVSPSSYLRVYLCPDVSMMNCNA
jgi:hypothetical protein